MACTAHFSSGVYLTVSKNDPGHCYSFLEFSAISDRDHVLEYIAINLPSLTPEKSLLFCLVVGLRQESRYNEGQCGVAFGLLRGSFAVVGPP